MTLGKREATAKVQLYFDLSWRVWPDWAEVRGEDETHHEFTPLLSRTYIQRSLTPEYGRRASTIKGITPPPAAGRSLRSLRGPCLHCIGINGLDIPQSKADQSRGQEKRNVRNLGRASERARQSRRTERCGGRRDFSPPSSSSPSREDQTSHWRCELAHAHARAHTHTHVFCSRGPKMTAASSLIISLLRKSER